MFVSNINEIRICFLPLLVLFLIVTAAGCKLEIENPVDETNFTHRANIHFSVDYKNCVGCAERVIMVCEV
jgi:hypothetical protein